MQMGNYILLVEDDEFDLTFTCRALQLCSVNNPVRVARDGEEALDILDHIQKDELAVILLDLKLPKVDGFDVLKRIRATPALKDTPVIIVSGSPLETDRVRALMLGANNYVAKALEFRDFAQLLALALQPYSGSLNPETTGQK